MNAIFFSALLAGLTYWPGSELPLPDAVLVAWKGAGVALLALWAAMQARDMDGWLLTVVLAFGAAGDVLLETAGLETGAAAFLAGHVAAILLYSRNRRDRPRWVMLAVIPVLVAFAARLPAQPSSVLPIALYSTGLVTMAVCAWLSRFPDAATGAWLFVASDLLIFAQLGPRIHGCRIC
jgi:uncharacterized membrane protein YhhN